MRGGGGDGQGAGAAGRVGDIHFPDRFQTGPIPVVGADGQRRQQRGPGGAGVIGTVVGGGVQDAVKDAAHHILPAAGQVVDQILGRLGDDAQAVAPLAVVGRGFQRRHGGLENGLVIQRQNGFPGAGEGGYDIVPFPAGRQAGQRPGAGIGRGGGIGGIIIAGVIGRPVGVG